MCEARKEKKEKKIKSSKKEKSEDDVGVKEESNVEEVSPKVKKEKKEKSKKSKKEKSEDAMDVDEPVKVKKEKKEKKDKKRKRDAEEDTQAEPANEEVPANAAKKRTAENGTAVAVDHDQNVESHLLLSSHNLSPSTISSLKARGVTQLFPIQAASFKPIMEGKDLLGRARTGTGKTLAFSLPMVETLKQQRSANPSEFTQRGRAPRVLIMAPTRELAMQVHREFDSIASGELKTVCVYGGTPYDQQCECCHMMVGKRYVR